MKKKTNELVLNSKDDVEKHDFLFSIDRNGMTDEGDGIIRFNRGQVITDDSEQWNGTRYDIKTLNVDSFDGKVTMDHSGSIKGIVGASLGIRKRGNKVLLDGIKFAIKESTDAVFAYNMMRSGYVTDFSTETTGPYADEEGIYKNAQLLTVSIVGAGNNKAARINAIVRNSIKEAEENGLDATELREIIKQPIDTKTDNDNNEEDMKYKFITNTRKFAVTYKFKNSAGDEVETVVQPGQGVDVPETQAPEVEKQVTDAPEPKTETTVEKTEVKKEETNEELEETKNALNTLTKQFNDFKKETLNKPVEEPQFIRNSGVGASSVVSIPEMDYMEIHKNQIESFLKSQRDGDMRAAANLRELNEHNLKALKDAKKVSNVMTLESFGNFVISPELLTEIEGFRSDFKPLVSRLNIKQTLSLQMAVFKRAGDIDMQEVAFCDDDADGNLKAISEYDGDFELSNLQELAAVTPVCNAATRFLAVDMLPDIAEGYRTDYDRKISQLFIARLQQAVNQYPAHKVVLNTATGNENLNPLFSILDAYAVVGEQVGQGGTWIFSFATSIQLTKFRALAAAQGSDPNEYFTTGKDGTFMGQPYIIVPNELMPALNSGQTRTFQIEGVNVTIREAIFYVNLANYAGRASGGLNWDMSIHAAYEVGSGENKQVRSAFQRNELLLRGSFFRGGMVKDPEKVSSITAPGVS